MPEDERARVFERFYRASSGAGSGLGLAIAKEIVERHAGRIGVAPAPDGIGACFWFELP
jgi:signal transduction histidine kinase